MYLRTTAALAAFVLSIITSAKFIQAPFNSKDGECATAHIFCIRGTTEQPGCGEIGKVVDAVNAGITGSDFEAIDYPATGINLETGKWSIVEYARSETIGIAQLTAAMQAYHAKCPNTPTAVMGYSQVSISQHERTILMVWTHREHT